MTKLTKNCFACTTRQILTCLGAILIAASSIAAPQTPPVPLAFEGAVGFGAAATGGKGGTTYHVTNLNDSGAGSFRDGVSQGHRTVVFDIGGTVMLKTVVSVHSDVTILGQTAHGEGITILGQEISFSSNSNIIVRYIRFREGLTGGKRKSTVGIHAGHTMIFDHCSVEWGRWDCLDMNASTDITFQNCIIGQGVNPQRFGCLCGSDQVTFWRNLFINNQSRNPKAKGHIQYINNIVYNWGVTGFVGGHSAAPHYVDVINNYFISGQNSSARWNGEWAKTDQAYQSGNYVDLDKNGKLNGRLTDDKDFPGPTLAPTPFFHPAAAVPADSAPDAYKVVLREAGASLHRDTVDTQLIDDLASLGTRGKIVEDPVERNTPGSLPIK